MKVIDDYEHPNLVSARNRKKLIRLFGKRGTELIRKGAMFTADALISTAENIERWLQSNRYGTEWR